MTNQFLFDPARTAVLSMDMQAGLVSIFAKDQPDFAERAASVLAKARELGTRVIHIQVGFRKRLPEVSARNTLFAAIKSSEQHQRLFAGELGAIHPALGPAGDDIVIVKHRVSAFTGTDLEMILRANEIETLVLFGIATSGVVLSTLVEAADKDFRLFVIKDCCIDPDADLHTALVERFFSKRGKVISAAGFLAGNT